LAEGDEGESGSLAAVALGDGLVVLDGCAAVSGSGGNDVGASIQKTLKDFGAD